MLLDRGHAAANALLTDVTQGRVRLGGSASVTHVVIALVAIVALVATMRFAL